MSASNPISPHPACVLDDVVHHRARLGILTVLGEVGSATFSYLKSLLGLTDGNLGRHIEVLAGDGLVSITMGYENRRPRTRVTITDSGDTALAPRWHCSSGSLADSRSVTGGR